MPDDSTVVARHPVYAGPVISLDEEDVRFPDGSTGRLAVVRHPGASAVVPFLTDPRGADPTILMIRQHRHATGGMILEIPAGRLERGEEPMACARRELLEETGCTASVMEPLITIFTTPGFSDERIHLFMATGLTRGETRHEHDEFIEPVLMPLRDALRRIESGEIVDGKTIVALLFAARFLANA